MANRALSDVIDDDNFRLSTKNYTYDDRGQLTEATGPGANTWAYDPAGNRIEQGADEYEVASGNRLADDGCQNKES